jgi:hypothetical protein
MRSRLGLTAKRVFVPVSVMICPSSENIVIRNVRLHLKRLEGSKVGAHFVESLHGIGFDVRVSWRVGLISTRRATAESDRHFILICSDQLQTTIDERFSCCRRLSAIA